MVTLSPAQDAVVQDIDRWLRDPHGRRWRRLDGPAGSGKTTLLQKLAEDHRVQYAAFTGKAGAVLRSKNCANATTVHRLLYRPNERRVRGADGKERWETTFERKYDERFDDIDVIALDECSMIDDRLARDLLDLGKRVLVVGDRHQLPPIDGTGFFVQGEPDWSLTEIHRQARESGILRLADDIRSGRGIQGNVYGSDVAIIDMNTAGANEGELFAWCEQILVGRHITRHAMNSRARELAGRSGQLPERGDRLICVANNHDLGLMNGDIFTVDTAVPIDRWGVALCLRSEDEPDRVRYFDSWSHYFLGREEDLKRVSWRERSKRMSFDYACAITVHKAQGSEFNRVLVIDESKVFRDDARRWAYTAATRAARELIWVRA